MATRILYIEDDKEIGSWVRDHLSGKGYTVTWLTAGEQAAQHLEESDLVVLDVMLPGLDGFTIGQRLKKSAPAMPILMLSARSSLEDKLSGLEFADDYLTKPFHPEELTARIEVLLRRAGVAPAQMLTLHHLEVFPAENRIVDKRNGEEIALTAKQLHIFRYLLDHANQILTKEQIYEAVWHEPYLEGDKTLMVHIRYLREKLEVDPGNPLVIETVRGIGYRVRV